MKKTHQYFPLINALCYAEKIEAPHPEYRFAPPRKFMFDFAWPERKIAIEIDGGIWISGRHSGGIGQLLDMEKFNLAVVHGWRVLHYTPQQLSTTMMRDLLLVIGDNLVLKGAV